MPELNLGFFFSWGTTVRKKKNGFEFELEFEAGAGAGTTVFVVPSENQKCEFVVEPV